MRAGLQAADIDGDGDAALLESDFKGVVLFALDIELVKFSRNFNRNDFLSRGRFDAHADDRVGIFLSEKAFVDFALNKILIIPEAISVIKEVLHSQRSDITEGGRFLTEEKLSSENEGDSSNDDADDEYWMGA